MQTPALSPLPGPSRLGSARRSAAPRQHCGAARRRRGEGTRPGRPRNAARPGAEPAAAPSQPSLLPPLPHLLSPSHPHLPHYSRLPFPIPILISHVVPVFHLPSPIFTSHCTPLPSHPWGGVPAAFHPTDHAQPPAAPPEPPHPHTGARCGTRASPAHHPHHPQPSRIPSGLSSLHGGLSSTGIPQPGSTLLDHQPEPRACLHTSCKAQTTGPSCKSFIRSNSDIFHETKPKEPLELENSGRTEHAPAFTTGHVPPLGVGF